MKNWKQVEMYLDGYYNSLTALCRRYNVKTLYAFGSVLTAQFNAGSDVDLIVDFEDIPVESYADNYFDFKFSLEDMLHRPIDLLEEKAIRNPYFRRNINPKKQLIYG